MNENVVFGFFGSVLDRSESRDRWEKWRPTVSLCQQDDFVVARLELFFEEKFAERVEPLIRDLRSVSPETEIVPRPVGIVDAWDFEEVFGTLHDFARGYEFDLAREDYFVHVTTGSHVEQICLFLLTESRHFPAKILQSAPAKKRKQARVGGRGRFSIIDLDLSRYDRLAQRFQSEREESVSFLKSGIETESARFNELIERIERVVISSTEPLLLTGPTGAGKSQLARRIYELRQARKMVEGEFVSVNCATLRGDSAMSALFGHTKGAFTGAVSAREGLLRTADKGLLFLDEVGELGPDEQAMLLRALEEGTFLPVGADREVGSAFQLIVGTNRDLRVEVEAGRFRADLLARIDLWTFMLPGLKDRREDIAPNVHYELDKYTQRTGNRITFNKEALSRFLAFAREPSSPWTRNFRDLNGAIVRMATLAHGGRIAVDDVEAECQRLRESWHVPSREGVNLHRWLSPDELAEMDPFDQTQLAEVIRVCENSRSLSAAGRELFSVSRLRKKSSNDADRLRKYLARFGLEWELIQGGGAEG